MRTRRSAKHLSDDGCDQTERGEPTHSPDQQLRHGAVSPCCQRRRLIQGKEQKEPVSKKNPAVASGAPSSLAPNKSQFNRCSVAPSPRMRSPLRSTTAEPSTILSCQRGFCTGLTQPKILTQHPFLALLENSLALECAKASPLQ